MNNFVLHKPEVRPFDLFGREIKTLTVVTTSLAEASYYRSQTPGDLFTDFYIKDGRFYIILADVTCNTLERAYDCFTGEKKHEQYALIRRLVDSCHHFEGLKNLYLRQGGRS